MMRTATFTILAALAAAAAATAQPIAVPAPPAPAWQQGGGPDPRIVIRQRERERERERARAERGEQLREEQVEQFSKTVRVGASGEIEVANLAGDIVVTRGGGSEARIDVVKKARARTADEAREMLKLVQVEISERAGRAEVRTRYPHRDGRGPHRNVHVSVHYTIAAPAGTRLTLKSMAGDVAVSDISGEVSAESMSGNVRIERAPRLLTAKTMSGNVTLVEAKSEAGIEVASMSGNVSLKQVRARHLNAECISGTLSLTDVHFERVSANSMSGDLIFQGSLAKNGRYGLKSHSGDVRLVLDGNTGFQVDAHTFSGTVRSDLPLAGATARAEAVVDGVGPRHRPRILRGVHGDGSAVLDLSTFSGNILISKR